MPRLLLHACCGPCSLEPVRLLLAQGYDITISYVNPNIAPASEYDHRLRTLLEWAAMQGLPVIEGPYDVDSWEREVAPHGVNRGARCRACYRQRLAIAADQAVDMGFSHLGTTLAVSPYQLFNACGEELQSACAARGLTPVWQDFRPYYPAATTRSRELGMYRQNYCGCRFSAAEAALERIDARKERERAKSAKM